MVRRIAAILIMGPALDANYHTCAGSALTYEDLGLSRDAARERKEAKILKRGLGDTRHEAARGTQRGRQKGPRKRKSAFAPG
jgi:hypothetical protein